MQDGYRIFGNHPDWGMTTHLLTRDTTTMANIELIPRSTASTDIYEIKVKGILDRGWAESFSDAEKTVSVVTIGDHACLISAEVKDQAALRGLVTRMWDLNMEIISINKMEGRAE